MSVLDDVKMSRKFQKEIRAEAKRLIEKMSSYPADCEPARFGMKLVMLVAQYPLYVPANILENLGEQLVAAHDETKNISSLVFLAKYFPHLKAAAKAQQELDVLDCPG